MVSGAAPTISANELYARLVFIQEHGKDYRAAHSPEERMAKDALSAGPVILALLGHYNGSVS